MSSSNPSSQPGSGSQPGSRQTLQDAPEWFIDAVGDDDDRDFAPPEDFFDIEGDDEDDWEDYEEPATLGKSF